MRRTHKGRAYGSTLKAGAEYRLITNRPAFNEGGIAMLWTIFVILLVLWLLGIVTSYTLYGYIHLLLIIAVVVLLIGLIQGRRVI